MKASFEKRYLQRRQSQFTQFLAVLVSFFVFGYSTVQAQPDAQSVLQRASAAGAVQNVTGPVAVERKALDQAAERTTIDRGIALFTGDSLIADTAGRLKYSLTDGSNYVLQENSSLTIEEYAYSGVLDGSEIARFQFDQGVMEFASGAIGKADESKFSIVTEFAVIGIRGSGAIITADSNSTQVFVTHGELTGLANNGELVVLREGETVIFDASGEPNRYAGNITGAEQTLGDDGSDLLYAEDNDLFNGSAYEMFTALLPVDPEVEDASQEQLGQALTIAIQTQPVLYAEFITIAIELGLEAPSAAYVATNLLLGGDNVNPVLAADIFDVSTAGPGTDRDAVEIAMKDLLPDSFTVPDISIEDPYDLTLGPNNTNLPNLPDNDEPLDQPDGENPPGGGGPAASEIL